MILIHKLWAIRYPDFLLSVIFLIISSCSQSGSGEHNAGQSDALTEESQHLPENALKSIDIAEGLEVQVMATEPMIKNPTNIDVDDRGRIWVTEAYNYRPGINGNPTNSLGDRIMILEDRDGDAIADTAKVFYQGPELNAPIGICVLEDRVIVSQSPYVWAFFDDNKDDRADRKEIMFQGIGGEQHDHGVHAFIFGPDGKLYFSFGNEGQSIRDKNGKPVRDQDGDIISPPKYKQGMVFRCDPDGSKMELLGHNFRNNYEPAIDSYGAIWQSDNDDDGNRSTRINYVMDYGNYGYTDEMTGAGWNSSRTNMEDSIPFRHWHLNDPGVVPNLLQTGAGSPAGIVMYEGNLLPAIFRNQIIHCDPGVNVVRSYQVSKEGAGYSATINNILSSKEDKWFRPVDIGVAPDGSLIVADWYDPGVGGHQAGDQQRGRIYRIAPRNAKYQFPKYDYSTVSGATTALKNPNLNVRNKAWNALQKLGITAVPELDQIWRTDEDPRIRARAFWVLLKSASATGYIEAAVKDPLPEIRMMGLRAARELKLNPVPYISLLVKDNDPQVRRESAISLRNIRSMEAPGLWTELALQYDGEDRWYLEALGIGANGQWEKFLKGYLQKENNPLRSKASRDIIWRARTEAAIPYLGQLASDSKVPLADRLRYFRAFDFNEGPSKPQVLLTILNNPGPDSIEINKLVLTHLDPGTIRNSEKAQIALASTLKSVSGTLDFVNLVKKYKVRSEAPTLLKMTLNSEDNNIQWNALSALLDIDGPASVWKVINEKDTTIINPLIKLLGRIGNTKSLGILENLAFRNDYPDNIRNVAARNIGKSYNGEERVLELLKQKKVPSGLIPAVAEGVKHSWRKQVSIEANSYVDGGEKEQKTDHPEPIDIMALKGEAGNGKLVFQNYCGICHVANGQGIQFGPDLSGIGVKLAPEAILQAIFRPSDGISFGYEGWILKMKDGATQYGIVQSKTESDIEVKLPGGLKQNIKTSAVQSMEKMNQSLMPEGLHQGLSKQELADLLTYMISLK